METLLDCKPIGYLSVSGRGYSDQKDPQIELVTNRERFEQLLNNIYYVGKVHVPAVDFNLHKVVVLVDRDSTNTIHAVMLSSFRVKEDNSLELNCHVLRRRENQGVLVIDQQISLLAIRIPKNVERWSVNFQKVNPLGSLNYGQIERPLDLEALQAKEQISLANVKKGFEILNREMPEAINREVYNKRIGELTQSIEARDKALKTRWDSIYLEKLGPNLLKPLS